MERIAPLLIVLTVLMLLFVNIANASITRVEFTRFNGVEIRLMFYENKTKIKELKEVLQSQRNEMLNLYDVLMSLRERERAAKAKVSELESKIETLRRELEYIRLMREKRAMELNESSELLEELKSYTSANVMLMWSDIAAIAIVVLSLLIAIWQVSKLRTSAID